jgi:hypothetical protein
MSLQAVLDEISQRPGPDKWLTVAAYAGAVQNPAWYHNHAAHPDRVSIELDGHTHHVAVEELHGTERDLAWKQITDSNSRFAFSVEQLTDGLNNEKYLVAHP